MSTNAIHEALAELERHSSTDCNSSAHASDVVKILEAARAGLAALEADDAALLAALWTLQHVESRNPEEGMSYCPACGECETGHTQDCELAAILSDPHPGAALLEELRTLRAQVATLEAENERCAKANKLLNEVWLAEKSRAEAAERRVAELEAEVLSLEEALKEEHLKAEGAYARGLVAHVAEEPATHPEHAPAGPPQALRLAALALALKVVEEERAKWGGAVHTACDAISGRLRYLSQYHFPPAPAGLLDAVGMALEAYEGLDAATCLEELQAAKKATPPTMSRLRSVYEAAKGGATDRLQRLETFAEHFAGLVDAAVAHQQWKADGSKGMQVPFHDDFANAPPSVIGSLRRLARDAREALKP